MSALSIALDAIDRGIAPVPVPIGRKGPVIKNWQHLTITRENAGQYFNGTALNVGAIMGPRSGGLTDVDLDCPEAVKLAPYFLPATNSVYGRAGKRRSHYLYKCSDPDRKAVIKLNDERKAGIVELRLGGGGKGAQSVMPGSQHKTGELYEWDDDAEPAQATCAELKAAVTKIAVGTIMMRHWPPRGGQHEAALTVGGFLARAGWSADEVAHFVEAVTREHGEAEEPAAHGRTARDSAERHAEGGQVFGLPGLQEQFGELAANRIAKLVGYHGEQAVPPQGGLPTIILKDGHLLQNLAAAQDALLADATGPTIFQRGGMLVFLHRWPVGGERDGIRRRAGALTIVQASREWLRLSMVAATASYWRYDPRTKKMRPKDPPLELAGALLAAPTDWKFKPLAGIIEAPTLRSDGSVLDAAGYDEASGLYFEPGELSVPSINSQPSRSDAQAALQELKTIISEFPFIDDVAKSVMLAEILTALVRRTLRSAPLFSNDAPVMESQASHCWPTSWPSSPLADQHRRCPTLAEKRKTEEDHRSTAGW